MTADAVGAGPGRRLVPEPPAPYAPFCFPLRCSTSVLPTLVPRTVPPERDSTLSQRCSRGARHERHSWNTTVYLICGTCDCWISFGAKISNKDLPAALPSPHLHQTRSQCSNSCHHRCQSQPSERRPRMMKRKGQVGQQHRPRRMPAYLACIYTNQRNPTTTGPPSI